MRVRYLILGMIIGTLAIQPVSRPVDVIAGSAEAPPLAVLMSCSGEVNIVKPDGSTIKGTFGMPLAAGDQIRTGKGGGADILFENGNYISIGAESSMQVKGSKIQKAGQDQLADESSKPMGDNGFQVAQNFLKLSSAEGSSSIAGLRGPGDQDAELRAVSPHKTRIVDGYPTFEWRAGDPSAELQLTVYDEGGVHWKKTVQGVSELAYPDDAPALTSGPSYSWKLESTDPLRYPPLSSQAAFFEIIPVDERSDLEKALERIDRDGSLSDASRHVMRASVYFNHGLLADAVAETEAALEVAPGDGSLQAILARLYNQVGRTAEAAELYDEILDRD